MVGSPPQSSRSARWCGLVPQVTLQEMLVAFKEVLARSAMFAHHHVQREPLSVRERMSRHLGAAAESRSFVEFIRLFRPEEGRMGVTVTFVAHPRTRA